MVRAKFWVSAVKQWIDKDGNVTSVTVDLNATSSRTGKNKAFWEATPSGQLTMTITNPDAYNQFRPGQEFYLDFTLATSPEPA